MRRTQGGYYKNQHSLFLLQYHLVLVTKYRHPVIKNEIEVFLKEYIHSYFKEQKLKVVAIETMPDHIHILFEGMPNLNLATFINAFKSASSRRIRNQFSEELRPFYWKPYFWSKSYFIGSVSERTTEAVKHYVLTQKE